MPDTSPFAECSRPGNFEQLISIFINIIFSGQLYRNKKIPTKAPDAILDFVSFTIRLNENLLENV